MTALPPPPGPPLPLTAAEYAALPEMEGRYELQEGAIVVAGSPVPDHQNGVLELASQLREQTPPSLRTVVGVDIDLELVPASEPGTVRVPDLVVVTEASFQRIRRHGRSASGPPTCCSPSRSSPAPPAAPTR